MSTPHCAPLVRKRQGERTQASEVPCSRSHAGSLFLGEATTSSITPRANHTTPRAHHSTPSADHTTPRLLESLRGFALHSRPCARTSGHASRGSLISRLPASELLLIGPLLVRPCIPRSLGRGTARTACADVSRLGGTWRAHGALYSSFIIVHVVIRDLIAHTHVRTYVPRYARFVARHTMCIKSAHHHQGPHPRPCPSGGSGALGPRPVSRVGVPTLAHC